MSDEILFFVKFGERQHMESLAKGEMYFSLADKFIKQEEQQQKKGQGDAYEGRMNMLFCKAEFRHPESNELLFEATDINMNFGFDTVANMPLFCLTAGYNTDCELVNDNNYHISFSETKKSVISEHFEKADTALIIKQPNIFIEDVIRAFGGNCRADTIKYYNMSIMTTDRLQYILNEPNLMTGGAISIRIDDAYKHLFCKDLYFKEQQEFRFIADKLQIKEPTIYKVNMNSELKLVELKEFFDGIDIEL